MPPKDAKRAQAELRMPSLYAAGAPDNAICRVLRISQDWVRAWREKNGLPSHGQFCRKGKIAANPAVKWEDITPIRLTEQAGNHLRMIRRAEKFRAQLEEVDATAKKAAASLSESSKKLDAWMNQVTKTGKSL